MARNAVQVVVDELDRFINDVMKKLALDLVQILASAPSEGGTPIDTGWASANWIPYLNSSPGKPSGSRPDNDVPGANNASRAAQQSGIATVATSFDYFRHDAIVVGNAVPYIVELNEIHAARGFVQKGMHKVVREFRRELRRGSEAGPDRASGAAGGF